MKKQLFLGIAIGLVLFALLAGASMSSVLFGLLVLACPVMMLFMMGGHGNGASPHDGGSRVPPSERKS